jgi:hypothetical protein
MLRPLLTMMTLLFGVAVQADLVNPAKSNYPANGIALVDKVKFNYGIQDRGWDSAYDLYTGRTYIKRTLVLDYESAAYRVNTNPHLREYLTLAVTQKCVELGQFEYADQTQINHFSTSTTPETEVTSSNFFADTALGLLYGVFVCTIKIVSN